MVGCFPAQYLSVPGKKRFKIVGLGMIESAIHLNSMADLSN